MRAPNRSWLLRAKPFRPPRRGTPVLVDGRDLAYVWEAFPDGSTSHLFPHVVVQWGPIEAPAYGSATSERVAVAWARVSLT